MENGCGAVLQKVHFAVRIPTFSAFIQSALSPIIPNSADRKNRGQSFTRCLPSESRPAILKQAISIFNKPAGKQIPSGNKVPVSFFWRESKSDGNTAVRMCAENSGIQTDGCAFPGKTVWGFGDFGIAVVKLKTGNPALRFPMELSERNVSFHWKSCF